MKIHQQAVIDLFGGLRPGKLLDAGSGGDSIGKALKGMGFDVVSLDLYEAPFLKDSFVKADLNRELPFRPGVFDYVLCSESLQYLENHAALIREFGRVVKPSGSVILSMPNLLNAGSRLYFLQRGYYPHFKPVRTVMKKKEWDSVVYNAISLVEVAELMKLGGFELTCLKATKFKASCYPLYLLIRVVSRLGLLFEKNPEKRALVSRLTSKEALLGDHLIIKFTLAAS